MFRGRILLETRENLTLAKYECDDGFFIKFDEHDGFENNTNKIWYRRCMKHGDWEPNPPKCSSKQHQKYSENYSPKKFFFKFLLQELNADSLVISPMAQSLGILITIQTYLFIVVLPAMPYKEILPEFVKLTEIGAGRNHIAKAI